MVRAFQFFLFPSNSSFYPHFPDTYHKLRFRFHLLETVEIYREPVQQETPIGNTRL